MRRLILKSISFLCSVTALMVMVMWVFDSGFSWLFMPVLAVFAFVAVIDGRELILEYAKRRST